MADFIMANELDDDIGDFDAGASTNSDNDKVDSILIKKILCEMKSEFNRGMCSLPYGRLYKEDLDDPILSENLSSSLDSKFPVENGLDGEKLPKNETENLDNSVENKIEIHAAINEINQSSGSANSVIFGDDKENEITDEKVVSKSNGTTEKLPSEENDMPKRKRVSKENQKKNTENKVVEVTVTEETPEKKSRRSLRHIEKSDPEISLKRSSRRMSKEYSRESVLQNAIARKEKSFSSLNGEKHRRSSRLSDEKNVTKTRTAKNISKLTVDNELNFPKALSDNFKIFNGKTFKTNLSEVEVDTGEFKKSGKQFDTPTKYNSQLPSENISEDEFPINYQPENEWEKGKK